jgi:hypothetical protein
VAFVLGLREDEEPPRPHQNPAVGQGRISSAQLRLAAIEKGAAIGLVERGQKGREALFA